MRGLEQADRVGRCYVRMARDGDLEEVAELPTNESGLLHISTVKVYYNKFKKLENWKLHSSRSQSI